MELLDAAVSVHTYFMISKENLEAFKQLADDLIETTRGEMGCLCYGFFFADGEANCNESYKNGEAVIAHLSNVEDLVQRVIRISEIKRLEVHGSEQQISKLLFPLKEFSPKYYFLEGGFRNYA